MKSLVLLIISVCLLLCRCTPINGLYSEQYKLNKILYSYSENSQTHDYSGNWDFDGDAIADKFFFVGNGGAHLQYCPLIVLSSIDSNFYFPNLPLDIPLYETEYPPKVGFSILNSYRDNVTDIVMNVSSISGKIQVVLSYKNFQQLLTTTIPSLLFSDGESATIINKYLDYNNIDSINVSKKSFDATYHHCGKGHFDFHKQDLRFIKDKTLREEIAYYYVIRNGEENLCEEPTAVLLSQGGEEFYLNTLKGVENACSFPENSPVTCQAYWLKIHTPNGVFDEVVIYDMKTTVK